MVTPLSCDFLQRVLALMTVTSAQTVRVTRVVTVMTVTVTVRHPVTAMPMNTSILSKCLRVSGSM